MFQFFSDIFKDWCMNQVDRFQLISTKHFRNLEWIASFMKWTSKSFAHFFFPCRFVGVFILDQRSATMACWPNPVLHQYLWIKPYWDTAIFICFCLIYGFHTTTAKLSSREWNRVAHKAPNINTIWPLTKNVYQALFYTRFCCHIFELQTSSPLCGLPVHFLNGGFLRNRSSLM